jgi:RimJ/RimL family protein N-acetyltransferase
LELKTKRLLLRPVKHADSKAIFEYRSDKKANQYQGFVPETVEEVSAFISKLPAGFNVEGTWFQLVVILEPEHQIIGVEGLHFIQDQNDTVELGCTISKSFQGNGFATEALTTIKDFLLHELGKKKLKGSVDPRNLASIKMLKNIGMSQIDFYEKSYNLKGEWVDDAVYQLAV